MNMDLYFEVLFFFFLKPFRQNYEKMSMPAFGAAYHPVKKMLISGFLYG